MEGILLGGDIMDDSTLDEFGRVRVSSPHTLFDSQHQYGTNDIIWETITTAGASAIHLPHESAVQLSVDTNDGCRCVRQTYQYIRYQSGKSQFVLMSGVFGNPKDGVVKRIGLFDDENGLFFEQNFSGIYLVKRSKTTGDVIDTKIGRFDTAITWNKDTIAGGGTEHLFLDSAKAQLFVIDFQWLGVGRIRFGWNVDGKTTYVHEMCHANMLDAVYMTTANLPLRYEILNIKSTGSPSSMKQLSSTVICEGGFEMERGYPFQVSNGNITKSATIKTPVLTIRPKTIFGGIVNRAQVILDGISMYASGASILYEIIYKGILTGSNFESVSNYSTMERDVSASSVSGGIVIFGDFLPAGGAIRSSDFDALTARLPITLDHAGENPANITVAVTAISGTATVSAGLQWREYY